MKPQRTSNPELLEDVRLLDNEVTWLHVTWSRVYVELFDQGEETDRLLMATAGEAFAAIAHALLADVVMGILRLADPPADGRHENASIERLVLDLEGAGALEAARELRGRLERYGETVKDLGTARNKVFSHNDLAMLRRPEDVPRLRRDQIEAAIRQAGEMLNFVRDAVAPGANTVLHGETGFFHQTGSELVRYLRIGAEYETLEKRAQMIRDGLPEEYVDEALGLKKRPG